MAGHNFDEESKMAVAVALDECLTNAIKHGNKNNKKLLVEITYKINPAGVEITIKDQGAGFDWRVSTRLRGGDDFTGYELCGRGLFMINNMMTSVAYNDTGNQVTIIRSNLN
jgi:serine/threonine-protein kinase RsbW